MNRRPGVIKAPAAGLVMVAAVAISCLVPAVRADELPPAAAVGRLFSDICITGAPGFEGSAARLESEGFTVSPYGETEFEFGNALSGISGVVMLGSGCSVMHEALSEDEAQALGAVLVAGAYGDRAEPWRYEGRLSGWQVPLESQTLFIVYNQGGLSLELRDN